MISNCGHDERGKYTGGQAGDQTGQEWAVIPWYNRPWNVVLRHNDWEVREKIAELAKKAAENNHIGYDQGDRYTFWENLKKVNYDPAKITKNCEADCSAGVAAIVKAVGYLLNVESLKKVSIYCYTGNLKSALKKAGFEVLTDQKYLTSDKYLLPGDVLLYEGHHTAINLDIGKEIIYLSDHWEKTENGYTYITATGTVKNKWALINHHYYLFDRDGYMVTGWHRWDGKTVDPADGTGDWYFLDNTKDGPLEGACWHSRDNGSQEIWYVE
jgi:hypothetical protein